MVVVFARIGETKPVLAVGSRFGVGVGVRVVAGSLVRLVVGSMVRVGSKVRVGSSVKVGSRVRVGSVRNSGSKIVGRLADLEIGVGVAAGTSGKRPLKSRLGSTGAGTITGSLSGSILFKFGV